MVFNINYSELIVSDQSIVKAGKSGVIDWENHDLKPHKPFNLRYLVNIGSLGLRL